MSINADHERFKEFLDSDAEPAGFNPVSLKSIAKIRSELVRSRVQLAFLYCGFSTVGYLASLFICAQNSLGLSGLSYAVAEHMHKVPDPWCPILCGAVFTGIPFLLSTLFLNRFQHRYLIRKMWWFFAAVPILGTAVMMLLPHKLQHARLSEHMDMLNNRSHSLTNVQWMIIWALSAILVPYLLESVVYLFLKPRKMNHQKV